MDSGRVDPGRPVRLRVIPQPGSVSGRRGHAEYGLRAFARKSMGYGRRLRTSEVRGRRESRDGPPGRAPAPPRGDDLSAGCQTAVSRKRTGTKRRAAGTERGVDAVRQGAYAHVGRGEATIPR
ncbi:hypothetical protein GCM10010182_76040 [Actinomadura cremea]|nr:hypothetical protein GCM10010182_76040 [Actinomadura cremea]